MVAEHLQGICYANFELPGLLQPGQWMTLFHPLVKYMRMALAGRAGWRSPGACVAEAPLGQTED